ncbi:hypothetical protein [Streptomyces sp. NPDC047108]|uniref:low affinity iron permease family protein n=1 Tax=Streptomyces sp. NPDC047108 TaxID=3155025 RepID=UPI003407B6DC
MQHPAERSRDGRGRFERLAGAASHLTASPLFYAFCLALVALFIAVHAAGASIATQILVGDIMTAVTLLLLALLKNSELRAERAVQRKLDSIAAALLEQRDGTSHKAHDDLERVIRIEEEL